MMTIFQLLRRVFDLLVSLNPTVKAVLFLTTFSVVLVRWMNALWASMFQRIDAFVAPATGSADFSGLSFLNYVFPLDTMLDLVVAFAALKLACVAIRIIKSFIPTIA